MAVSKRLRFEILRRDNHACRYCGATAPAAVLVVDHVVPTVLGGSDDPSNLVTACEPCNSGKTSSSPDAPIVADVAADALRWARAMERAALLRQEQMQRDTESIAWFDTIWTKYWWGGPGSDVDVDARVYAPRPSGWESSIRRFLAAGLDMPMLARAVRTTVLSDRISRDDTWRYFCGICWRELDAQRDIAASLVETSDDV